MNPSSEAECEWQMWCTLPGWPSGAPGVGWMPGVPDDRLASGLSAGDLKSLAGFQFFRVERGVGRPKSCDPDSVTTGDGGKGLPILHVVDAGVAGARRTRLGGGSHRA